MWRGNIKDNSMSGGFYIIDLNYETKPKVWSSKSNTAVLQEPYEIMLKSY
jgi:hypothetical protein